MNEQEHAPQKDQLPLPRVAEQLRTKLFDIGLTAVAQDNLELFYPERLADALYPPNLQLMSSSYLLSRGGLILDRIQHARLDRSTLKARTQQIDLFVIALHPTSDEVQEVQMHPEARRQLYIRRDVMQDLRLTSFIMDQKITKVWLSLSDEQFAYFLDVLDNNLLPACLTSDEEMVRLHADEYRFKDNPTYLPPNMPSEFSARERFIDICSDDVHGDIRLDIDIPSAFKILQVKFPQK